MSDNKRPEREWRFYLDDMMDFAQRVLDYTDGLDKSTFIADRRTYDATSRNTVWSIIQDDVPDLLKKLEQIQDQS